MRAYKKITFSLLISSTLSFSGWAGSGDYSTGQKEKKKIERPVEKDKKKNEDRGGGKKDEGGKKGKKP